LDGRMTCGRVWRNRAVGFLAAVAAVVGLGLAGPTTAAHAAATPPSGTIVGNNSGLCLSVTGSATSAGASTDLYTCNGSVSETWTLESNGTILNNNSGLCLSATGNSSALKTVADINTCDGDAYEQWTAGSGGTLVEGASGLCLSVTGSATTLKATADLYTCNSSASEFWTVPT